MTDNDIVKALECCTNEPMLNCRNCPYEDSCNMGRSDMQKDALDLINRQKAEILELQGNLKFVRGTVERLLESSNKQQAEIAKLKAMVDAAEEYLQPLPFKNAFDAEIAKTRAEAIIEFAKKLENKLANNTDISAVGYQSIIADIDNLVKEMTEDTP